MGLKRLGVLKEIVEAAGMGITYVYDDLVFVEHNAFLLQFADAENAFLLHVNRQAETQELEAAVAAIRNEASAREMVLHDGCSFILEQVGDEEIRLEFFDAK